MQRLHSVVQSVRHAICNTCRRCGRPTSCSATSMLQVGTCSMCSTKRRATRACPPRTQTYKHGTRKRKTRAEVLRGPDLAVGEERAVGGEEPAVVYNLAVQQVDPVVRHGPATARGAAPRVATLQRCRLRTAPAARCTGCRADRRQLATWHVATAGASLQHCNGCVYPGESQSTRARAHLLGSLK
jgi:hypothetical protein